MRFVLNFTRWAKAVNRRSHADQHHALDHAYGQGRQRRGRRAADDPARHVKPAAMTRALKLLRARVPGDQAAFVRAKRRQDMERFGGLPRADALDKDGMPAGQRDGFDDVQGKRIGLADGDKRGRGGLRLGHRGQQGGRAENGQSAQKGASGQGLVNQS